MSHKTLITIGPFIREDPTYPWVNAVPVTLAEEYELTISESVVPKSPPTPSAPVTFPSV